LRRSSPPKLRSRGMKKILFLAVIAGLGLFAARKLRAS
jgi:hypothetical protein